MPVAAKHVRILEGADLLTCKQFGRTHVLKVNREKLYDTMVDFREEYVIDGQKGTRILDALKEVDSNVLGMIGIFTYGFDIAAKAFEEKGVELITLSDYNHLLEQAKDTNYISNEDESLLKSWIINPSEWNK